MKTKTTKKGTQPHAQQAIVFIYKRITNTKRNKDYTTHWHDARVPVGDKMLSALQCGAVRDLIADQLGKYAANTHS